MVSKYVFSHKEIEQFEDIRNKLTECDKSLRNAKQKYPFEWLSKNAIFAITLPTFDNIDNWEHVISEFEDWYYSIATEIFIEKVNQHLALYTIEDIVKFRAKGSMHHHFGVNFDTLLIRLNDYGLNFSGTNLQKNKKFWAAINNGLLTKEQVLTALRKVLLPPGPSEVLPQKIYGKYITPVIRPCFINFKETLKRHKGISELLEQLFVSARMKHGFVFDKTVDKNELNNNLKNLIIFRGESYGSNKDTPLSTFLASSLHALLVFLFKKGLITLPTVDNMSILNSFDITQDFRLEFSKTLNNPNNIQNSLKLSISDLKTNSFINPSTEYVLQSLNKQKSSIETLSTEPLISANDLSNLVVKYNELPDNDSLIAVYISNAEAACSYRRYDETIEGYATLFNRTDKVVVLLDALHTHDIQSILNDFVNWASTNHYDVTIQLDILNIEKISSRYKNLFCLIEDLAMAIEEAAISQNDSSTKKIIRLLFNNHKESIIDKEKSLAIGDLLIMYFWLQGFILMPSYKRALGLSIPLKNHVKGATEILENNRDILINDYLGKRPSYFNILEKGLFRAITASNPISNINIIHEGQLELIYKYGYSYTSNTIQSAFRKGVRGFIYCLANNEKKQRLNANRLSLASINKRLSVSSEDIWLPWKEANLHLWHQWLHILTNKSERLKNKTNKSHINNHLLGFFQKYSKLTGNPIPESPFGVTPQMIISESNTIFDFQEYVQNLKLKTKSSIFSAAKHIFDTLEEHNPSQWTEVKFIHPFPKRIPFQSNKRNTTHRRPIESLHLDAIKEVLLSPDKNGKPTFEWVMNEYCAINNPSIQVHHMRDILVTDEGTVWWPGTAICLAFLLEVPVRGIQGRWLDEGCLDDERYSFEKNTYVPNPKKISIRYPDGKSHNEKYKHFNGNTGVLQQRPISFMDSIEDVLRGPSLFINTNKTSMENQKFHQGYFIPWPNEEGMDLPYWLINYMMEFNQKYDPTPKPINFAYEGEMNRAKSARFIYSFSDDAEKLNQYPFVTPLFRDLTKDSRYSRKPNAIIFDKDGNEMVPPVSRLKISNLLNAVAKEAEKRLLSEGYPASLASMTDQYGKIIYDIHTLRVTGVSRLMALGVPIEVVRDVVGHAVNVMTYYYSVLDQLEVMKKLREGLSIDMDHFPVTELTGKPLDSNCFPNVHADPSATVQYGGWVERNGGICPSGTCDEGGPAIFDDDGNTVGFTSVPGGQFRCGNCRLWMSGPKYIPQQAHFIDLLMNEIVEIHEDRLHAYESKIETDTEITNKKSTKQEVPQSLFAKSSELDSKITQLTEKLSYLWVEWRNRYHMLETSIGSLDKNKDQLEKGKLVLFTGQDTSCWNIQRHVGSKFGLRREIANSIVYHIPITHEVNHALNNLERHMTKLQLFMSSNDGHPVSISQILDDDLRNRAIAIHAQHLYLIMQKEVGNADQRIDRILDELQKSLPNIEAQEYTALEQWHKVTSKSLKDMLELPDCTSKTALIPLQTNLIDDSNNDD